MTISLDPGGTAELPDCATWASEQGGTAIVSAAFCLGTCTVRMPGSERAVDTASELELDELLLLLLPQALSPSAIAATATMPPTDLPAALRNVMWVSSP